MRLALERIVHRILGVKLLALAAVVLALYSAGSAYIGSTLVQVGLGLEGEPSPPQNMGLLSIYSGVALTPFTGLLPQDHPLKAGGVEGVVEAWGETTTPALVNGSLVIVRGVPWKGLELLGARVIMGSQVEGDEGAAIVGAGLAEELGLHVGDRLVVDPLFTRSVAVLRVEGIVEAPPPYRYEVLVNPLTGMALRGHMGYSTVRILYDPSRLDAERLAEVFGVESGMDRILVHQAVLLISRGLVEVESPERLQSYYVERLGVPPALIVAVGLSADALLAILTVPLARLVAGVREESLRTLVEEGAGERRVKASLILAALPYILAGVILGLYLAGLLPSTSILGYPVAYNPSLQFMMAHTLVFTLLYASGVAWARLEG